MTIARVFGFSLAYLGSVVGLAGCGGDSSDTAAGTMSTEATGSGGGGGEGGAGSGTSNASAGAGGSVEMFGVTFRYRPQWSGVTSVRVVGGFGKSDDWAASFVTLTSDGNGAFSATAALPKGDYLYLFQVIGDDDGKSNNLRHSLDSDVSYIGACPDMAPIYDPQMPDRPCARMRVPQPSQEPLYHVTGSVVYDGAPIGGYLVVVDRAESPYDEWFVNRTNSAPDGSFDLLVPQGSYRIQVQHPTYLNTNDADRDPIALQAVRRTFSSRKTIAADWTMPPAEVAYHDYAALAPTGMTTLPTDFSVTIIAGAEKTRVAVYGTYGDAGMTATEPWYSTTYDVQTTLPFDGVFNMPTTGDPQVTLLKPYFWGTWQQFPVVDGITWRAQSMVMPILWTQ